ncbi:unnamed protein product [Phaedon cochleariae]|uniref:DUF4806 domain-containing protein n=1 Tax=Phaedon cochleariae TaxID=80249 RepID=A0A9N9SDB2_PHACE|nr:unnamed protein product [Phaedon cochleariae]
MAAPQWRTIYVITIRFYLKLQGVFGVGDYDTRIGKFKITDPIWLTSPGYTRQYNAAEKTERPRSNEPESISSSPKHIDVNTQEYSSDIVGLKPSSITYETLLANQNVMLQNQGTIMQQLANFKVIFQRLAKDNERLRKTSTTSTVTNTTYSLDGIKPIDSLLELVEFEEKLSDKSYFEALREKLAVICDRRGNGTDLCYILVDKFFTRKFMIQCSWAGGYLSQKCLRIPQIERYPNRRIPNHKTFARIERRLRETGMLKPVKVDAGRRRVQRPNREEAVLELINDNPEMSSRSVQRQTGIPKNTMSLVPHVVSWRTCTMSMYMLMKTHMPLKLETINENLKLMFGSDLSKHFWLGRSDCHISLMVLVTFTFFKKFCQIYKRTCPSMFVETCVPPHFARANRKRPKRLMYDRDAANMNRDNEMESMLHESEDDVGDIEDSVDNVDN